MASLSTTTLFDLNEDCLLHLCSFLPIIDILRFHFVSNLFEKIAIDRLKTEAIVPSHYENTLPWDEIKKIFLKYGQYVQRLIIDEWITLEKICYYKMIGKQCVNIEILDFAYPSEYALEVYVDILSRTKKVKSVMIRPDDFIQYRDTLHLPKLESKLCRVINNRKHIQVLHLCNLEDISGKELSRLTKLKDLNLSGCFNFEESYFLSICERNRLRVLDISHCLRFGNASFEKLSAMKELISLSLSHNLEARNYTKIGDIENLREFSYDVYEIERLDQVITVIVENHSRKLEKLIITNDLSITNGVFSLIWPTVLCFENLRILEICAGQVFNSTHFIEIGKHMRKLEEVVLKCWDLKQDILTVNDLMEFLKFSRVIRKLTLYPRGYTSQFIHKSLRVWFNKKANSFRVDGCTASDFLIDIMQLSTQSADYATVIKINISDDA